MATKTAIAFKAVWEEFHQNCAKATAIAIEEFPYGSRVKYRRGPQWCYGVVVKIDTRGAQIQNKNSRMVHTIGPDRLLSLEPGDWEV